MYLAQNQTNYVNSTSLNALLCVMLQVKHLFIYVLLFTEPGSLSTMSVAVGYQLCDQFQP